MITILPVQFFLNHCRKLFQIDKSKTIRVETEIRSFLVKACKIAFRKQNHLPFASLPIVSLALDLFFFFFLALDLKKISYSGYGSLVSTINSSLSGVSLYVVDARKPKPIFPKFFWS